MGRFTESVEDGDVQENQPVAVVSEALVSAGMSPGQVASAVKSVGYRIVKKTPRKAAERAKGRPTLQESDPSKYAELVQILGRGVGIWTVHKITGVSYSTVYRIKKKLEIGNA